MQTIRILRSGLSRLRQALRQQGLLQVIRAFLAYRHSPKLSKRSKGSA